MNDEPQNVAYRWTPTPEERAIARDCVAAEYAVESEPAATCGLILWSRNGQKWEANPWSARPVLRHLLAERAEMAEMAAACWLAASWLECDGLTAKRHGDGQLAKACERMVGRLRKSIVNATGEVE